MARPSPHGSDGRQRDARGKFRPGNRCGVGNPLGAVHAKFQRMVTAAVSDDDLQAVVATLIAVAKAGDVQAAKVLLDRCCGRVPSYEELALIPRIEELEAALANDRTHAA